MLLDLGWNNFDWDNTTGSWSAGADVSAGVAASRRGEALGLWRGRALADVSEVESLAREGARLEELRLAATEGRIEADLALGLEAQVAGELEGLVAEYPVREISLGRHATAQSMGVSRASLQNGWGTWRTTADWYQTMRRTPRAMRIPASVAAPASTSDSIRSCAMRTVKRFAFCVAKHSCSTSNGASIRS